MWSLSTIPIVVFGEIARRLHPSHLVALKQAFSPSSKQFSFCHSLLSSWVGQVDVYRGVSFDNGLFVTENSFGLVLCDNQQGVLQVILPPKHRVLRFLKFECGRASFLLASSVWHVFVFRLSFTKQFVRVGKWRGWRSKGLQFKVERVLSVKTFSSGLWIGLAVKKKMFGVCLGALVSFCDGRPNRTLIWPKIKLGRDESSFNYMRRIKVGPECIRAVRPFMLYPKMEADSSHPWVLVRDDFFDECSRHVVLVGARKTKVVWLDGPCVAANAELVVTLTSAFLLSLERDPIRFELPLEFTNRSFKNLFVLDRLRLVSTSRNSSRELLVLDLVSSTMTKIDLPIDADEDNLHVSYFPGAMDFLLLQTLESACVVFLVSGTAESLSHRCRKLPSVSQPCEFVRCQSGLKADEDRKRYGFIVKGTQPRTNEF